jgi:hypothetical protein
MGAATVPVRTCSGVRVTIGALSAGKRSFISPYRQTFVNVLRPRGANIIKLKHAGSFHGINGPGCSTLPGLQNELSGFSAWIRVHMEYDP